MFHYFILCIFFPFITTADLYVKSLCLFLYPWLFWFATYGCWHPCLLLTAKPMQYYTKSKYILLAFLSLFSFLWRTLFYLLNRRTDWRLEGQRELKSSLATKMHTYICSLLKNSMVGLHFPIASRTGGQMNKVNYRLALLLKIYPYICSVI